MKKAQVALQILDMGDLLKTAESCFEVARRLRMVLGAPDELHLENEVEWLSQLEQCFREHGELSRTLLLEALGEVFGDIEGYYIGSSGQ